MNTQEKTTGNLSDTDPLPLADLFVISKTKYASPTSGGFPIPTPAIAAVGKNMAEVKTALDANPDFYISLTLAYNALVVMHKDHAPKYWVLIADAEPKPERR